MHQQKCQNSLPTANRSTTYHKKVKIHALLKSAVDLLQPLVKSNIHKLLQ